jgi:hypothetical protein
LGCVGADRRGDLVSSALDIFLLPF